MGVAASLKRGLQNSKIEPVYIFTGNDAYTKKEYETKIFKALTSIYENCEKHIFRGGEVQPGEVIDEVAGSSLFASYKLVIVKDVGILFKDKSFKNFVEEFSGKDNTQCTLVAEYENTDYPKGGIKGLSKKIQHNFMLPYENQLPGWVKGKFRDMGKSITSEGANFLIFCCSNNLFNITREMDKLITAYPDIKQYGLKEVRSISADHKKDNIFGYLDALTLGKEKKALMFLDDLIKYGSDPIYIIGMLRWKFQQLITVKKLMMETDLSESGILKKAGLNLFVNRGLCSILKGYSLKRLIKAYDRLFKTDISMKSSGVDNRILIEEYSIWFMSGN